MRASIACDRRCGGHRTAVQPGSGSRRDWPWRRGSRRWRRRRRPTAPARPTGGGARPVPARPAQVSRPAPSRPAVSRPEVSRPSVSHSPSINPGNLNRPATRPSIPQVKAPQIKNPQVKLPQQRPGNDFQLPGNAQRPAQLPKADRPPVQIARPGGDKGGNIKGKLPDFKGSDTKLNPKLKGNLADLQKKNPGLFDRPKAGDRPAGDRLPGDRLPGAGTLPAHRPDQRPGRDDVGNWLGMPKDGAGMWPGVLPGIRPGGDKVHNDFTNNWKNAIHGGDKINIGDKKIGNVNVGNINVDLSKNVNYQNLHNHANNIHNNFRPVQNNWFNNNWWGHHNHSWPWWHYHHYPRPASWWWRPCTWGAFTGFVASAAWAPPVYYDYGSNVVIQQDVVYVNEQPVASAPVYAQQAIDLADVAPPPQETKMEWLSLGTWALDEQEGRRRPQYHPATRREQGRPRQRHLVQPQDRRDYRRGRQGRSPNPTHRPAKAGPARRGPGSRRLQPHAGCDLVPHALRHAQHADLVHGAARKSGGGGPEERKALILQTRGIIVSASRVFP